MSTCADDRLGRIRLAAGVIVASLAALFTLAAGTCSALAALQVLRSAYEQLTALLLA